MMSEAQMLTVAEVGRMTRAFLQHIADHWEFYREHLPHLRRSLLAYNEFAYGIRFLPENNEFEIEFNPKHPLVEDLPEVLGERYTEEIGDLVYGAWPRRRESKPWEGYEEPIEDTPEALAEKQRYTTEQARHIMYDVPGTEYGWYEGRRVHLTASGTPEIWYRGFTTVEEFSAQKEFLDSIREHPRVKLGIQLMEAGLEAAKQEYEERERVQAEVKQCLESDECGKNPKKLRKLLLRLMKLTRKG